MATSGTSTDFQELPVPTERALSKAAVRSPVVSPTSPGSEAVFELESGSRPAKLDAGGAGSPSHFPQLSATREALLVFVLMFAQIITQAGVTQGLMPLHFIGVSFGVAEVTTLSWSVAAYSLTVGTFILCAGRLGDLFGHKRMYLIGFLWLVLGSLLAGLSHYTNFLFFCVCRGLQGIGPAFLLPNALAIIGRSYPPGVKQNMVFSLFGACAPSGAVLGAVFTSLLAQLASWEWTFYICAAVSAAVGVLCVLVIPADEPHERTEEETFDYWGTILGVSGLVLFNVAWNQGPNVGWVTPYTYILLIAGVLLVVGFFFVETRVDNPLVPLSMFNRKIVLALCCVACGWGTFGIWIFYIIMVVLLTLRQETPLMATAQTSPVVLSGLVASGVTGLLLSKKVPVAVVMSFAMAAFLGTSLLLAMMPLGQTYWAQTFASFVLGPFGMDMSFPAATIMFSTSVPRKHQGMAASVVATVVNYSISIALGFAGTLVAYTTPGETEADLLASVHGAAFLGAGLSGLGLLCALVASFYDKTSESKEAAMPSDAPATSTV